MGKRVKQYKKLMRAYEHLGFRQPYQLLLTSDILLDTVKVDLVSLFEKTLSTKNLKPMITQCCIRALYDRNRGPNRDPAVVGAIERAKTFERRRCGHLMDEDALPEQDCVMSVVDPKGNGQNKFRYIVATLDEELRARLRSVVPTPLMYVRRSVLILEPMSSESVKVREREERVKFAEGIIRRPQKRRREEGGDGSDESGSSGSEDEGEDEDGKGKDASMDEPKPKKKKRSYVKGPNPLSVKKAKTEERAVGDQKTRKPAAGPEGEAEPSTETKAKRKRRKKAKTAENAGDDRSGDKAVEAAVAAAVAAAEE